jgi:8-oxo-dGTP pyrophosphatase MutT (NUDIX family)
MDSHAGEVAWPGGKHDPEDGSLETTALRESHEEIGLLPERVTIVTELRPFISKYGLLVTPYVGLVEANVQLKANPAELDSIFQVPLSWLRSDPRTQTDIVSRHGETHEVPVYHYEGFRIWGLTAMILWEFMVKGMGVDSSQAACDKLSGNINEGW